MKIEKNKNLLDFNSYKIKVRAKYFVELKNKQDFENIFLWVKENKIKKYFILGGGANTIFVNEKYSGVILKISNNFIDWKSKHQVEVGAGKNWDDFLALLQRKGKRENKNNFYDIQALSSIPGSVGAGVFGNIGAFGTEIKKYIFGVWAFDLKKQKLLFLENEDLGFSYRQSVFKKNKGRFLIFSALFDFSPKFQKEMKERYSDGEYFSLEHFAKKHNLGNIKKSEIRKNIKKIRRKIYPDLKKFPNVGSTFKNTEISKSQLKKILKKYSDMPYWSLENGRVKIPTAYIFDKILNLKGKRFGNIEIDSGRPLFFKNMGGATGKEFYNLCQKIKKMAKKEIGVDLEEEVVFVK